MGLCLRDVLVLACLHLRLGRLVGGALGRHGLRVVHLSLSGCLVSIGLGSHLLLVGAGLRLSRIALRLHLLLVGLCLCDVLFLVGLCLALGRLGLRMGRGSRNTSLCEDGGDERGGRESSEKFFHG